MLSTRTIGAAALSLCAGLSVTTADAQIFQRAYGDDARETAYSIERTSDGGYVTAGFRDYGDATGGPAEDVLITKYKADGTLQWQRLWKGPGRDIGYSVQQTPDGGYIVAAESTSSGSTGMNLLLIRLDAFGSLVWNNYYPGGFMSDTIHTPEPGVALDQGADGEIYVTGDVGGVPLILAVDPTGGLLWNATYVDPTGADFFRYAFTDIKYDRIDNTIVVSGTSQHPDFNFPGGPAIQDAFMMRTNAAGTPIWAWNYDFPFDLDPDNGINNRETGDGLDIGPNGDIILNGRTDFGTATARRGTHLIATDRAGLPVWSSEYFYFSPDGLPARPETAYAAVRWNAELSVVQTGRLPDAATGMMHAWESLTSFSGAPLWIWRYGGENASRGESVIPTRDPCGYAMAGQFEFIPPTAPFARGETYLVKNNDLGMTGCLEDRLDFQPDYFAQPLEIPIAPFYIQQIQPAEDLLVDADAVENILCFDPDCTPGTPCPCDVNGDGILDLNDIAVFIACFTSGLPCGDLNGDGILDLNDINLFVSCFLTGCP